MIQVTEEVQKLIDEYNRCCLLNTFFYEHPECTAQLAKQLKVKLEDVDRFIFVSRMNAIERLLITEINNTFHNKPVILSNGKIGIIKHKFTRTYYDNTAKEYKETDNTVSFRNITNDSQTTAFDKQTIALWVEFEDKDLSHLYTIDKLTLI